MEDPIITNNRGDVNIHRTAAEAIHDMEACDVVNGEYVAYDAAGRLLGLRVVKGQVAIEEAEAEPTHADELRGLLAGSLSYRLETEVHATLPLEELVKMRLEYDASFQNRAPFWKRWFSFFRNRS